MGFDMLQAAIDVTSVTDPRMAAAFRILQRSIQDYNEREITHSALRTARTGRIPSQVTEERGTIGSLLQNIGVLGEPEPRALNPNEETGANLGMLMYEGGMEAKAAAKHKRDLESMGLLGELGGAYGQEASGPAARFLGLPPDLAFGSDEYSDVGQRRFDRGIKERETTSREALERSHASYYNRMPKGGGGTAEGNFSDLAKFVKDAAGAVDTLAGTELKYLDGRIAAVDKELIGYETRERAGDALDPEEAARKKNLERARVELVLQRRDIIDKASDRLDLPGSVRMEGSAPYVAAHRPPNVFGPEGTVEGYRVDKGFIERLIEGIPFIGGPAEFHQPEQKPELTRQIMGEPAPPKKKKKKKKGPPTSQDIAPRKSKTPPPSRQGRGTERIPLAAPSPRPRY